MAQTESAEGAVVADGLGTAKLLVMSHSHRLTRRDPTELSGRVAWRRDAVN